MRKTLGTIIIIVAALSYFGYINNCAVRTHCERWLLYQRAKIYQHKKI